MFRRTFIAAAALGFAALGGLAADASALYARNLYNFVSAFWDREAGRPVLSDEDEIVQGVCLTRAGSVVSDRLLG